MKNKLFALVCALVLLCGCGTPEDPFPLIIDEVPSEAPPAATVTTPVETPEPTPVPTPAPEPSAEPSQAPTVDNETHRVSFMAVGDNILHNTVLDYGLQSDGTYNYDQLYCQVNDLISSYDLAAVNQESPLVTDPSRYSAYPEFGSPTAIGDALAAAGFDIVTMATNHMCDKGDSGILQSVDFWKTQHPEVTLLGIHDTQEDAETVKIVEKNGIKIALLDYTYGYNGYGPSESWMCDTLADESRLRRNMEVAEAAADCTIVFVHAGEEYQHTPDDYQRKWLRFFAENGAEAVIGSHPHVLQPMEVVETTDGRSVPIYWSLGNFMSHQLDTARWIGGMATFDIVKENGVVSIENAALTPTFTYIWYEGDTACFRAMLLENVTQELVDNSYYNKYYGTVDALWELYNDIIE